MNSPSPSPLVPQGAIPPKDTSRSKRVLMVATMVVGLHVAGLSVVLFQGCGKGNGTNGAASNTETNAVAGLSYDTNVAAAPMFTPATNTGANIAQANTNIPTPPAPAGAFGATPMPAPGPGASLAGTAGDPSLTQQPVDTTPNVPSKEYKVQARDTLSAIATKNGASLSAIMKLNPTLDPKKLRVGQSIKIPIAGAGSTMAAGTASTPPTGSLGTTAGAVSGTAGGTYKVKAGDTLTKIARTHGITVNQLRAANNMKTTQVQVGKVLKIPARTQKTAAADTNTTQH